MVKIQKYKENAHAQNWARSEIDINWAILSGDLRYIYLPSVLGDGILGVENRVWYTGVCVKGQMKRETGEIPVQGRCCDGVAVLKGSLGR